MKRFCAISMGILVTMMVLGQTPNTLNTSDSRKAYINHLEMLFEEGRHCYVEIGNKSQLLRIIESYDEAIHQGFDDGMLDQQTADSLLLSVKCNKLYGDYHYLNSDDDPKSYAEAEKYFMEALSYIQDESKAQLHKIHYFRFVLYEELGQLYYKQERYEKAYAQMMEAYAWSRPYLYDDIGLDFISQLAICEARMGNFDEALDNIQFVLENYQGKNTDHYSEALRKKAKILMLKQESGDSGMADPADDALKCYKEYFTLKKADAMQRLGDMNEENRESYWMHIRPFVVDCYRTEAADPAFLYDVTLFSKSLLLEYALSGRPKFCTWQEVQKKLQPEDCAIEFFQYEKNGSKKMGALVLKKKGEPQFIRLVDIEMLENMPLIGGGTVTTAIKKDNDRLKNILYSDSTFYSFIWTDDLLRAIGENVQRVYFAPDGIFHFLAIEYMIPNSPWLTSLKSINFYRLTSTRQLLAKSKLRRNPKMLACGWIDYNVPYTSMTDLEPTSSPNDRDAYYFLRSLMNPAFPMDSLPGTLKEISAIEKIYGQKSTALLSGEQATESKFKSMATQFPIIHLSTHGAFCGITNKGTDILVANYDESLSRNMVCLAGANSTLFDNEFDASQYDGILSAREMAKMDLSNVELIVLSACQTGLGYLTDDGVYGLQRGLKNAGVKGMILTLWSVDDNASALFMQAFYHFLQTEDIHTAFMHARNELLSTKQPPIKSFDPVKMKGSYDSKDYSAPCFSNAFILIDIK